MVSFLTCRLMSHREGSRTVGAADSVARKEAGDVEGFIGGPQRGDDDLEFSCTTGYRPRSP